jgi:hypothetical protein
MLNFGILSEVDVFELPAESVFALFAGPINKPIKLNVIEKH